MTAPEMKAMTAAAALSLLFDMANSFVTGVYEKSAEATIFLAQPVEQSKIFYITLVGCSWSVFSKDVHFIGCQQGVAADTLPSL
jgi:uncharacterized protein (UPF0276 family)